MTHTHRDGAVHSGALASDKVRRGDDEGGLIGRAGDRAVDPGYDPGTSPVCRAQSGDSQRGAEAGARGEFHATAAVEDVKAGDGLSGVAGAGAIEGEGAALKVDGSGHVRAEAVGHIVEARVVERQRAAVVDVEGGGTGRCGGREGRASVHILDHATVGGDRAGRAGGEALGRGQAQLAGADLLEADGVDDRIIEALELTGEGRRRIIVEAHGERGRGTAIDDRA